MTFADALTSFPSTSRSEFRRTIWKGHREKSERPERSANVFAHPAQGEDGCDGPCFVVTKPVRRMECKPVGNSTGDKADRDRCNDLT
jgi:hypothetical protein